MDDSVFFDVECPGCGNRFGWSGGRDAAPGPCPRCGYRIVPAELDADRAEIAHARVAFATIRDARVRKDRAALLRALEFAAAPRDAPAAGT